MEVKTKTKNSERCPACGSSNLKRTADHSSKGYNGYKCRDCGCEFGN